MFKLLKKIWFMKKILNNYCTKENGLFLFNPPTGSGKTYNVLQWIFENYRDYCIENRKIFFITNLKKNLPSDELRDTFFIPNNKELDFEKHVIFLDSNSDALLKNFKNIESSINESFKKNAIFKPLKHCVTQITKHGKSSELKGIVGDLKNKLRDDLEPKFRGLIEKFLKENYPNKKERINAIQQEKELQWIGELYPAVFSSKRKIFFLSIDKFYYKNSTLVEPSYSFLENNISKDALVFIDEFDATKDSLLRNIIKKGLEQKTDFIHIFTQIYWALSNNIFPENFTIHSEKRTELIEQGYYTDLKNAQETLKEKAEEIVKKYKTNYSFKSKNTDQKNENQRNLLFHDFQYHTVYRNNKNAIRLNTNDKSKINEIIFEDKKPEKEEENIVFLLNQIKGFLNYFCRIVKSIAENYQQLETQERIKVPNRLEFTFDLAISSVIEEFGLDKEYKKFIINTILNARIKPKKKDSELNYDFSVYENGFRYYDFVDNDSHQSKTKIHLYNFENTPEKFMLKLAEKSKIIGISATALIETVTGNYDISYFKRQLGNRFFELKDSEKKYLSELFNNQNKYYDKIQIETKWVDFLKKNDSENKLKNEFTELLEDKELANVIIGKIKNSNPKIGNYLLNRYLKIGFCFKEFLLKDKIKGFLCLLNKEPKLGDENLDLNVLEEIFCILIKDTTKTEELFTSKNTENSKGELEYNVKNSYIVINSNNFEEKKQSFINQLEKGKKIFIISMYQTMGAGQNLQYIAPNPSKLINVRNETTPNWNKENKTDINAIYLDKPTHLIQIIDKNLNDKGFIKYLFQLEFLVQVGKVSVSNLNTQVATAFKHLLASFNTTSKLNRPKNDALYKDENIKEHFAKYIIQALGRICRTNLKSTNIYIYADAKLDEMICDFDVEKDIVLNEFKALVQSSKHKNTKPTESEQIILNLANLTNKKVHFRIKRFINSDWKWSENKKIEWEKLRDLCLSFPTISEKNVADSKLGKILDLYIKQPKPNNNYSYSQEQDYKNIQVDFNNNSPFKVSQESARLEELFEITGVKPFFESKKWATEFEVKDYILPPELFNNIYKGALGEQVGKFIFEKHLKIELEELPLEHYELFDFKIKNKNIYIDFKHWKEQTEISSKEQLEKIQKKLNTVNGKKVLIINILASSDFKTIKTADNKIIQIPYLWNLETKQFNEEILNLTV